MTRLYVDQREIAFPQAGMSLDAIIRHVEDRELAPHSIINRVQIDGTPLSAEYFQQYAGSGLTDISGRERIDIFTSPLDLVIRDSVREALSYLQRVETAIPLLAAGFQAYPGPEAFDNLKQLYEGFQCLILLLDKLERTLGNCPAEVQVDGASLGHHHESLRAVLRQLVESQERGDYILISDLLEYEVLPFVAVWKKIFQMFDRQTPSPVE